MQVPAPAAPMYITCLEHIIHIYIIVDSSRPQTPHPSLWRSPQQHAFFAAIYWKSKIQSFVLFTTRLTYKFDVNLMYSGRKGLLIRQGYINKVKFVLHTEHINYGCYLHTCYPFPQNLFLVFLIRATRKSIQQYLVYPNTLVVTYQPSLPCRFAIQYSYPTTLSPHSSARRGWVHA